MWLEADGSLRCDVLKTPKVWYVFILSIIIFGKMALGLAFGITLSMNHKSDFVKNILQMSLRRLIVELMILMN